MIGPMDVDPRAILAANNNADLYEAMFAAWALRFERHSFAFISKDHPPPYYSDLSVLAPGCISSLLDKACELQTAGRTLCVKDSFCEINSEAFTVLFEASWIWRLPQENVVTEWTKVRSASGLHEWEAAWNKGGSPTQAHMFRTELLRNPKIAFLQRKNSGHVVAGCIANKSNDCVGLSNVFSVTDEPGTFRQASEAVASVFPPLPCVGYAAGPKLESAIDAGFEPTGELRVAIEGDCGAIGTLLTGS